MKISQFRETKRAVENWGRDVGLTSKPDVIIVCVLCFVAEARCLKMAVIYQTQIFYVSWQWYFCYLTEAHIVDSLSLSFSLCISLSLQFFIVLLIILLAELILLILFFVYSDTVSFYSINVNMISICSYSLDVNTCQCHCTTILTLSIVEKTTRVD